MVATVLAVAMASQPPQLGVAELAPIAREAPDAPPTTGAATRDAAIGRRRGGATTTSLAPTTGTGAAGTAASSPPTTKVGRARQCVGNPSRQIADPRSPRCAAVIFEGDNGGATAQGVTGAEIRVAVLSSGGSAPSLDDQARVSALFEYMNRHYEFYGRRLVPVYVPFQSVSSVPEQRAVAEEVTGAGVFGTVGALNSYWYPTFSTELARNGVLSVVSGSYEILSDRDVFDEWHPYIWSVYPSAEQTWRNLSDFICVSLKGRTAAHAGSSLSGKTRSFGIVVSGGARLPATRPLVDGLEGCGVTPQVVELPPGSDFTNRARTALTNLKSAGVTTVICACADYQAYSVADQMDDVSFDEAEWLLPSFTSHMYEQWYLQFYWPEKIRARTFGLQPLPKVSTIEAEWWLNAAREVNPAVKPDGGNMLGIYERLLVLAAGIQGAGPALTADSFALGLMNSQFANEAGAGDPYWLPSVGFGPGDHSLYSDYALAWWNPQAPALGPGISVPVGSWCYLDRGARYSTGHFPADADARFFSSETCR